MPGRRHRSTRDAGVLKVTTRVPRFGVGMGPEARVKRAIGQEWKYALLRTEERALTHETREDRERNDRIACASARARMGRKVSLSKVTR